MLTIPKTKAVEYLDAFENHIQHLIKRYNNNPIVAKLIRTFADEQRDNVEHLTEHGNHAGHSPGNVFYSVGGVGEIDGLIQTLADLLIEKKVAWSMSGPGPGKPASPKMLIDEIHSGELCRKFSRMRGTLKSIDVESQSLVYQFRRSVGHSKNHQTFPKTMEVLREIRKELRHRRWEF